MTLKNKIEDVFVKNNKLNKRLVQLINSRDDLRLLYNEMRLLYNKESPSELIYLVVNELNTPPKCANDNCTNSANFVRYNIGYTKYCCNKCSTSDPKRTTSIAKTKSDNGCNGLDKTKKTNMERYGVEYPLQNKSIHQKTIDTQVEQFGGIGFQSTNIQQKAQQSLVDKFGKKSGNASTNEKSIQTIKNVEYFKLEYIDNKKSFNCLSRELGISRNIIIKQADELGIPREHHHISYPQQKLLKWLDELNIKYVINDRTLIHPKELDFFFPDYNLAIEVNGLWWHSDNYGWPKTGHLFKTIECRKKDIHLLHFYEFEILHKWEIVQSIIKSFLKQNERIYARRCVVKEIPNKISSNFVRDNHISGNAGCSVRLGLYYNDILVSAMTFGKPRYNKNNQYEMVRFCNKVNVNVVGGASKLFKYFINNHEVNSVVSYSDLRLFSGKLYKELGFVWSHRSVPSYHYFKEGTYELKSRVNFQKHKLQNLLPSFDDSKSEWENMKANKYNRIWDCGNDVWEWFS